MKHVKRALMGILCLALILCLFPAFTAAEPGSTKTVYVGVISYVQDETGTSGWQIHYWGGEEAGDADCAAADRTVYKSVGADYWNGDEQPFHVYTAQIPADATGFKVHNGDRWFGEDGNAASCQTAYVFNYDGDKALYNNDDLSPAPAPTPTPTPAPTPTPTPVPVETITVYFTDALNWGGVNVHYWGDGSSTEWPGAAMTAYEVNDYNQQVYSANVPADVNGIIFNGNGYQTVNITEGISDGAQWYTTGEMDGSNYRVALVTVAPGEPCGDTLYWSFEESTGTLTITGSGAMDDYTYSTSEPFYSYPWYSVKDQITSVQLPSGLTSIGSYAFAGLDGLTSITIPNGVTSIGDCALSGCTALASVTIPDSVASLGYNVFEGCTELTSVALPSGITTTGIGTFAYCTGLTSVTIPDGVTTIGEASFGGCTGLTSVVLPDSVTIIGPNAFNQCSALASINIPDGVTTISYAAFSDCQALTTLTIPDGVTSFGSLVVKGCRELTSIALPGCVTSIGDTEFLNCVKLASITIPGSVTSVGDSAFLGCPQLADVYFLGTVDEMTALQANIGSNNTALTDAAWHVSGTCGDALAWSYNSGTGVLTVSGTGAMNDYWLAPWNTIQDGITSVELPDGLTHIGDRAFDGYTGLLSISIPDSVTSIGICALEGCQALTSLTLPENLTTIGESAFRCCSGLSSLTIPDGVTTIGTRAFYSCSGLLSVTIPDSVASIDEGAFQNCSRLTSVSLPDGLTSINASLFETCANLKTVTIPASVTSIGNSAFQSCSRLTDVYFLGTAAEMTALQANIGSNNDALTSAAWHCAEAPVETITVYFTDALGWGGVNVHYWGDGSSTDWPGVAMTAYEVNEYNQQVYSANVPADVNGIIFNGNGYQTVDITEGISDGAQWYTTGEMDGSNYRVALVAAEVTTGTCGDNLNWSFNSATGKLTITGSGDMSIIQTIVSQPWAALRAQIREVSLPDGLTSIGNYGFAQCTNLTSVTIPDSVTNIRECAFFGCTGLASVTMPDSVASIGQLAFQNCTSLTSFTIPSGVTSISGSTFNGCTGLASVTIPDGVTSIGSAAFNGCTELFDISIPSSVTTVSGRAFFNTGWWNDQGDGLIYLDDVLVGFKGSLEQTVTVQPGTRLIADSALGSAAVDHIVLSSGVTHVGEGAFRGATAEDISISDTVVAIGKNAFQGCESLSAILVDDDNGAFCSVDGVLFSQDMTRLVAYPQGKGQTSYTIPNGVTTIGSGAFLGCDALTSVTIPDGVVSIEDSAFQICEGLTSIVIPDSVTSIGKSCFSGCLSLTMASIGNGVSVLPDCAFTCCSSLTSLTLGDGVTLIDTEAISQCTALNTITLGAGINSIEYSAFRNDQAITDVYFRGTDNQMAALQANIDEDNGSLLSATWHLLSLTSIEVTTLPDQLDYLRYVDELDVTGGRLTLYNRDGTTAEIDLTADMVSGFDNTGIDIETLTVTFEEKTTTFDVVIYDEGDCDDGLHWHYRLGVLTITGSGDMEEYADAESVPWHPYRDRVTTLSLPAGLTAIGSFAFQDLAGLTDLTIPDGLADVGDFAFWGCTDLASLTLPASATCGFGSFLNCAAITNIHVTPGTGEWEIGTDTSRPWNDSAANLQTVTLDDGITAIGAHAFDGCTGLTGITIPDSVVTINEYAFQNCTGLTSIDIPDGIGAISDSTFSGCQGLTQVTLPDSLTSIGNSAFQSCSALTSIVIPDSVTSIGSSAFSSCSYLTDVNIPESVIDVGSSAFHYTGYWNAQSDGPVYLDNVLLGIKNTCPMNLSIQNNTRLIASFAVYGQTSLYSVIIPDSVKYICEQAFCGCHGLKKVTMPCTAFCKTYVFYECTSVQNVTLTAGDTGVMPDYPPQISAHPFPWSPNASQSDTISVTLSDGITNIGDYVFMDAHLASISIPDSVTEIGDGAFSGSRGLTSIPLPENLTTIGEYAFWNTGLTSITIPSKVTSIGQYAFSGNGELSEVTIQNSVIGFRMFSSCGKLTSIIIPDGVDAISDSAFSFCSGLTSVTIGNDVSTIGSGAFYQCAGVTSLTLPQSAEASIDGFYHCTNITSVHITCGTGEWKIANAHNAPWYNSRTNALSITLDEGITAIGDLAFRGCTGITSITIPDSVTSIGENAFAGCSGLTEVTIGNHAADIYYGSFQNCTNLSDVYYHGTPRTRDTVTFSDLNDDLLNATWHYLPVNSIEWVQQPDALAYFEGQALSVTGGQIKAYYDYDIEEVEDITADMVSGYDSSVLGAQTLTVTFGEKTLTYDVTVNHVPGEAVQENVINATCTEVGSYDEVVYCSVCNAELSREAKTIDALGHDLVYHEAMAATCTEVGWEAYDTCSRCDYTTYAEIPALGHDKVHHDAQAATCTEVGWEAYDTCSRCDYTTYVEILALGHNIVHHEAKAATCTEVGWEAYDTCSRCDYTTYVEIPALGHALVHHDAQAATCTEVGWEAYDTCSRYDYTTYVEIPALGHNIVHHEAKAATCTEVGWEAYDTCSRCDYTTYAEIPALGHALVHHDAQAATCTEVGWNAYDTCSRCDYTTYVEIPATGHTPAASVEENRVEATCTEAGSYDTVVYCSVCHAELSREENVLNKLGHTPGEPVMENLIPATNETAGSYDQVVYCTVCHAELSREGKVIDQLSTTFTGVVTYISGRTVYLQHDVTGVMVRLDSSNADLLQQVELDKVVTVTGITVIYAQGGYSIPQINDAMIESVADEGATATTVSVALDQLTDGLMAVKVRIQAAKTELAAANLQLALDQYPDSHLLTVTGVLSANNQGRIILGADIQVEHAPAEAVRENVVDATCTDAGSYDEVVYCSICGTELSREAKTSDALGHNKVHHDAQAATCTEIGWEAYDTCSRCDYTTYAEIPALGHALVHHDAQTATCTEVGWEAYDTCSRCDYTTYAEIPALGHNLVHHEAQAATCTEVGWEAYDTCTRCDYSTYEEIPAHGHHLVHHEAQDPTGDEPGWEAYDTCTNCAYTTYIEIPNLEPPTITTQPSDVIAGLGSTATFRVVATDAESYQWQYMRPGETTWNDVKDNGQAATFNQTNVATRHNGFQFRCKVTNAGGSVLSNVATLTLAAAPTITTQPANVTAGLGGTATFKVVATNATGYQWQYQRPNETAWYDVQNGGRAATFNQTNVAQRHNGFKFRCKVSNAGGSVLSNVATLTLSAAPTITTQPSNATAGLGATATFRVTASNATGYQWQYQRPNETTWYDVQNGGRAATFNQTDVAQRHNGFKFRCKVSNAGGSVLSNVATLTLSAAPTITTQPSNATAGLGSTATFKVVASNATSYQWQYQRPNETSWNTVQNGGQAATFNQTNVAQRHNGFKFRCKVSNAGGSVLSNVATLTLSAAPTITTQPSNVTAGLGSTATFKVVASNATGYQWQYMRPNETTWNDVQVDGKSATFNQTGVAQRHNGFQFRCKVTNASGSVLSNVATLTVAATPTITSQPANVTAALGSTATFRVVASNATSYQWQYQKPNETTWNDVKDGGQSATFNQTNVATRHNGFLFRCKVTNASGSVLSNTAKLTVAAGTAPTITTQPSNVTASLGTTATFKVVASNAASYQWQYKRPNETTWNDVKDGGQAATFNQTNVATRHNGFVFRCKVTNASGTVYSSEATLTVK